MTLNQLIEKAEKIRRCYTSGDIPIYYNGYEAEIYLNDIDERGLHIIAMSVKPKPQPLQEIRYIKEVEIIPKNSSVLWDMIQQRILERVVITNDNYAEVAFPGSNNVTGWLIQFEDGRWYSMTREYHEKLVKENKLIKV